MDGICFRKGPDDRLPLFSLVVITLLIKGFAGSLADHPLALSDFPRIFFEPIDQFWFLYALFILLMVSSAALKLGLSPLVIFVSAILVYPGLLPISSLGLGILNMTRLMAVYLALGVVLGNDHNIRAISNAPGRWLIFAVVAGLMVSSLAGWSELPSWSQISYRDAFPARFLFAVSGIAAIAALSLLAERVKFGSLVRFLGQYSLEIYVVHSMVTAVARIALLKVAHVSAALPQLLFGTLVGLYVPIAIALIFKRAGIQFAFVLPKAFATRSVVKFTT